MDDFLAQLSDDQLCGLMGGQTNTGVANTGGMGNFSPSPFYTKEVEEFLQTIEADITVAVMGCAVNGPGEARNADIGIAGGIKEGLLFKKGEIIRKIPQDKIVEELKKERAQKSEKLSKQEDEITAKFKVIEDLKGQLVKLDVKKTKIEEDINGIINKMWEEYELTPNNAEQYQKPENVALTQRRVNSLRTEIRELGSVNVDLSLIHI